MLWIKNDLPLEYKQEEFDYIKSLVRTRNPNNKSNIIIVNFSGGDLGYGAAHRDVFTPEELEIDLFSRAVELMNLDYIKLMIIFAVDANVPVLDHVHKYPGEMESHYQSIVGLSPNNDIKDVMVNEVAFDMTGHNHILLNVKMPHYVKSRSEPTLWLTPFCSRMK
jgi:hypothetical protein